MTPDRRRVEDLAAHGLLEAWAAASSSPAGVGGLASAVTVRLLIALAGTGRHRGPGG